MSHFAKVEDGIVVNVIVAEQDFVNSLEGAWIQTSYNTHGNVHLGQDGEPDGGIALRKNFAGLGFIYDSTADGFHSPKPFPSWSLNSTTFEWEPPVEKPDNTVEGFYEWDEEITNWVFIETGDLN